MRRLSELEKQICHSLLKNKDLKREGSVSVCNFFTAFSQEKENDLGDLALGFKGKRAYLAIKKSKEQDKERRRKLIFIVTFFKIFQTLEEERYLYLFGDSEKESWMCGDPQGKEMIALPLGLSAFIEYSFEKMIFVTQDLTEYVENNFCSKEDIHHRESKKLAWLAIGVAVAIALLGLVYG